MNLDVLANLTWREALIALVALLALYVIVVFWRWYRLRLARPPSAEVNPAMASSVNSAISAYTAEQSAPSGAPEGEPELLSAPSASAFPWNEPPDEIPGQHRIEALEREVTQLRKEVGGLRAEVLVLREQLRENEQAQAQQPVSPLYSDAMQMAMQGHDATTISQHCGIARAEAELVVALVRNRNN